MCEKINAQRGEYTIGNDDDQLIWTEERLRHEDRSGNAVTVTRISREEITAVRTQVDKSVTGFGIMGAAVGAVALLLTVAAIELFAEGAPLNAITVGTYFSAVLAWPTAVWLYRSEHGVINVLIVETEDEVFRFYTRADEEFDRIVEDLRERTASGVQKEVSSPAP